MIMLLLRSGHRVPTFFDLLGRKEDDMTFGLGLVASRSEQFLSLLIGELTGTAVTSCGNALIRLQTSEKTSHGRTDVEIDVPGRFAGVLEAKRGANLPSIVQLSKYLPVLHRIDAPAKCLTTVTNAPQELARRTLPPFLDGIPLKHLTWRKVRQLARRARADETNRNKTLLDEFSGYLTEVLGMEKTHDNMVYVLSLSRNSVWGLPFLDVVRKQARYFYPVTGGGWPEPPNYVAFRYDGCLQSIHHVEGHDVFTNPHTMFAEAEDVEVPAHYCLHLGPTFAPARVVRAGPKILRSARVWVMLDTLFTCDTITDALNETKRREAASRAG
jgi:hypothetical protein